MPTRLIDIPNIDLLPSFFLYITRHGSRIVSSKFRPPFTTIVKSASVMTQTTSSRRAIKRWCNFMDVLGGVSPREVTLRHRIYASIPCCSARIE
ncbi:hypothetical protein WG66_003087 [Moniliophthora roreri]|nr:hypothetical protein WG66_003087 [Moniliophthora roreri]